MSLIVLMMDTSVWLRYWIILEYHDLVMFLEVQTGSKVHYSNDDDCVNLNLLVIDLIIIIKNLFSPTGR